MFKKQLINLILLWLVLVFSCFFLLFSSSFKARKTYQRLISDDEQVEKEDQQEKRRATQQTRYQVSKQILYKKELHRMQSRLASESSDLIYSKGEGELVEHFKGLTCMMQEKWMDAPSSEAKEEDSLSLTAKPQQVIRQLKAKKAVYSYKSGQLQAEEVKVAHYLIPGHLWPDPLEALQPLFEGHAESIQLLLFKEPTLKAQGFQAIFHSGGDEW